MLDEQVLKLRDEISKLRLLITQLQARKSAVAAKQATTGCDPEDRPGCSGRF